MSVLERFHCNQFTLSQEFTWPLTSAYWVHSNVYGLSKTKSIRYLTTVDPFLSTSSALQMYHHLTSGSVEIPLETWTGHFSSIGEEPVRYGIPIYNNIRKSATTSLVSLAEQGIITFINLLQDHNAVVLVCCTSEWEPDITCTWEGRDTNVIMFMWYKCKANNKVCTTLLSDFLLNNVSFKGGMPTLSG